MKETAIYIHIPFCVHKCIYCDFYSITSSGKYDGFHKSLLKEIEYYAGIESQGRKIVSIFFGGGTPSLLEPKYISSILLHLRNNFNIEPDAEITLEANPGTLTKTKLKEFLSAGINRLSIGIQSFNHDELKFLTRIHDASEAEKTVFKAYDAGFTNLSLDLIFNLPGQNLEKWSRTLERAISLPVKHLSAYSLILEPGTILNKMVLDGKTVMEPVENDAELYEYTLEFLTRHGFNQYEVSNFCREGYECKHNNVYWHYGEYFGFGPSAHSFINGTRSWNFTGLTFYNKAIGEFGKAAAGSETLTNEQKLEEFIMLALRSSGLDYSKLSQFGGENWKNSNQKEITGLINSGLAMEKEGILSLTNKGYLLCDEIIARLK